MTSVSGDARHVGAGSRVGEHVGDVEAAVLLDTLSEVVFRTDAEGRWTYLNRAWTRLTGFEIGPSLGARFLDYVHPDELEYTVALFMGVVAGGANHCHHETRYRTSDGSYRRVQIRANVLRDGAGEVIGNTGTILDVTDSRRGSETIGEHAALLELVSSDAPGGELPVGVVVYDADLRLRRGSPVVDRLAEAPQRIGDPLAQLMELLAPAVPGQRALGGEWGLVAVAKRTNHAQVSDLDIADPRPGRSLRVSVIPYLRDGEEMLALVLADITDLRRAEHRQAGLARLGHRAISSSDTAALVSEAAAMVASTLSVAGCELIHVDPRGGDAVGTSPLLDRVLADDQPVVIDSPVTELARSLAGPPPDSPDVATVLATRVGGAGLLFGVLAAHSTTPRCFTDDEVQFVQAVADILTAALERDRTDHELRRLYRRAEHGRAWLAASAHTITQVLAAAEPRDALDLVAATARTMAGTDIGVVAVPDEHGNLVITTADVAPGLPAAPDSLLGLTLAQGVTPVAEQLTAGGTVVLDSLDLRGSRISPAPDMPIATALILPLRITQRSSAVLILGNHTDTAHLPLHDVELIEAFTHDAALAVELVQTQHDRARLAVYQDRDRIARDLHDQVIQRLFAIGLHLQSLTRAAGDITAARLTSAINALDHTIDDIRHTIFDLHPTQPGP
ncbi:MULTISPECIES: GAF domain-containing protein [unclassified Parafrankia]|uniref:GAF domain-containing protein n=1 Tax=unclassified Parafrankia TaxID=2994368 RepID=UPI000DA5A720|nr:MULTISPECIES: GAF domain-containing protein [unclassified Parafrankia]TCJ32231.1 PAS domain-containing protein [Parafrankia sp. BMG5.11]SQD93810.1 putative PAS/PAC sensor protein [Parafrankia sp. Ea1.12]